MARKRNSKSSTSIVGILVLIVLVMVLFSLCSNDKSTKKTNVGETEKSQENAIDAPKLVMTEGFDELQSLFLQIDESYSEDQVSAMAKEQGFITYKSMVYGNMDWLYVSTAEKVGTKTGGESATPIFNTDTIKIVFTKDNESDDKNYYAFTKSYRGPTEENLHNDLVEYTFYDDGLSVYNNVSEEWKTLNDSPYDSLEEALGDALRRYKD